MAARRRKKSARRKAGRRSQRPKAELATAMSAPGVGPSIESLGRLTASSRRGVESVDGSMARLGISWGNPTFPIFFWVKVNGQVVPPPYYGENGLHVLDIVLNPGANLLSWGIRHTGQGWRNQVWLQIAGQQPLLLKEDADPGPGTEDDLSTASDVKVAA